jgi:endonuclease/exonuclease/phosphatase family metal-dependent hydrolase
MAGTFKIGTFNCHNLFSRPRVLNRENRAGGDQILAKIDLLREELDKVVFDQAEILRLWGEINIDPDTGKSQAFIEVVDLYNKLFGTRKTGELFVKPKGKKDWDGFISFKRDKFTDDARLNTVKVIHEMDADILSLIEVEDKSTLDGFNTELIGKGKYNKYPYTLLIDSFDPRGIDVALVSRHPFEDIRTHMYDKNGKSRIFSRDCLEVKLRLRKDDYITVYINHFKSQGYGTPQQNDARRLPQAQRVADIILKERELDMQQDKVVVLGDFNADTGNQSLAPLLNIPGLTNVLMSKFPDIKDRWTYYYEESKTKKYWQQLDYILVSVPLMNKYVSSGIIRNGIYDLEKISFKGEKAWKSVQDVGPWVEASDHAGVWLEFGS